MKKLNELMSEIIQLTAEIETKYPELYKFLDETPFEICAAKKEIICREDLEDYLTALKSQLIHHKETHKN